MKYQVYITVTRQVIQPVEAENEQEAITKALKLRQKPEDTKVIAETAVAYEALP